MDFGKILTKAWKVIWKHKILWLFGVLAGCAASGSNGGGGGGGGGGGANSVSNMFRNGQGHGYQFLDPTLQRGIQEFFRTLGNISPIVWVLIGIAVIITIFVLSILFLMVGTLGTTGVIKGTIMADEAGPDAKPISFGEVFRAIKPYYWKVFLLNLGLRVVGFLVILFLGLPLVLLSICTCGLGILLVIILGIIVDLMVNFTTIAIVEDEKGIFKGIERAWEMITQNFGNVLLMFLILGIGQLIIGLIIALPLVLVPAPLVISLISTGFRTVGVGLIISIILFAMFIPLVIFLSGVLRAYVLTSWTLTYQSLRKKEELEPTVLTGEDKDEGQGEAV